MLMRFKLNLIVLGFSLLIMMGSLQAMENSRFSELHHSENENINSIHGKLLSGDIDCRSLIEGYLDRIAHYDLNTEFGVPLNAFVTINPSVRDHANWLDDYYQQHDKLMGPLHCIPIVVKDNIDTYDMPTSAGTLALMNS
ncbi:MAG: amidase, partial [Legionellales bacterium]|nr:amidase [Legionellales bacterium]